METCIATLVSISLFISSSQIHTNTGALNKSFLLLLTAYGQNTIYTNEGDAERVEKGEPPSALSMTLAELFTWNFIVIQMFLFCMLQLRTE